MLSIVSLSSISMDNPHIPPSVRDSFNDAMASVQKAKLDERAQLDVRQHKRHSREHSTIDIHATITDAEGKETVLDLKKDGTLNVSSDSEEKKLQYSRSFVLMTNSVTGVLMGLIGAGVTLAVKYTENCKKN